jgi:hypothetical protein
MDSRLNKLLGIAALSAACSWATAAPVVIAQALPNIADGANGLRVDLSGGLLDLSFSGGSFVGYTITSIEWWGFNVDPASAHRFDVNLNGTELRKDALVSAEPSGAFPAPDDDIELHRYYIDSGLPSISVGANNVLSLRNTYNGLDAQWYWQFATGTAQQLSYRIYGEATTQVPEPGSALLVAIAGFGLLATRRRQA